MTTVVGGIYGTLRHRVSQGRTAELPQLLPVLTYAMTAPFLGPEAGGRVARAADAGAGGVTAPCAVDPARPPRRDA
ncbi:hypothetical protein E1258_30315 [Micromonospora sp. KC207]|uniref:hypothetical protein n=1 Tax=Micromonospora sp. (strain ATCC 39149 / NRRL 15099 / SCC 1413) TaxID=219305 RepID=UPI0001A5102E|nr:hypothetical protein [Micromonospora sp. ATCC 39149]EEP70679.1 hypothetical protein MCAG_01006 [Micromonospora sp. ATCC 39149]TDC45464.1 hypothetical protein E1258_30315 [Micromonospora sp. KC207]